MKHLKVALSDFVQSKIKSIEGRTCVGIFETDFTDVGAVVIGDSELELVNNNQISSFGIPLIVLRFDTSNVSKDISLYENRITSIIELSSMSIDDCTLEIEKLVINYEASILPPFFSALSDYVGDQNLQFDCPGHQGGQFFYKHPTGRAFYNFFGENIFRADLCNADVKLGDLLIHEGYAYDAQAHAAKVYNADKTYFVLNGTSSANKVVLNALLTPGDIIL